MVPDSFAVLIMHSKDESLKIESQSYCGLHRVIGYMQHAICYHSPPCNILRMNPLPKQAFRLGSSLLQDHSLLMLPGTLLHFNNISRGIQSISLYPKIQSFPASYILSFFDSTYGKGIMIRGSINWIRHDIYRNLDYISN